MPATGARNKLGMEASRDGLESVRWRSLTRGLGADAPVASARRGVAATGSVMGSGRLACGGGPVGQLHLAFGGGADALRQRNGRRATADKLRDAGLSHTNPQRKGRL